MMSDLGEGAKIPDLWRMSASLEICPKDVKEQMLLRLDEVGENYDNLKVKVISYTSNKAEQSRGQKETAVPMELDYVSESEMYEEKESLHFCGFLSSVYCISSRTVHTERTVSTVTGRSDTGMASTSTTHCMWFVCNRRQASELPRDHQHHCAVLLNKDTFEREYMSEPTRSFLW